MTFCALPHRRTGSKAVTAVVDIKPPPQLVSCPSSSSFLSSYPPPLSSPCPFSQIFFPSFPSSVPLPSSSSSPLSSYFLIPPPPFPHPDLPPLLYFLSLPCLFILLFILPWSHCCPTHNYPSDWFTPAEWRMGTYLWWPTPSLQTSAAATEFQAIPWGESQETGTGHSCICRLFHPAAAQYERTRWAHTLYISSPVPRPSHPSVCRLQY